ncbi:MAG: ubiquitin-like domain-containing protein [Jatrophihabitantaceae bacterium]
MLRSVKYGLYGAVLAGLVGGTVAWTNVDKTVDLVVDGRSSSVHTTAGDVGDVLAQAGYHPGAHDILAPAADVPVHDGSKIVYSRGRLLLLNVDGVRKDVWTTAPTVSAAMAQLGYSTADFTSVSRSRRLPLSPTDIAVRSPKIVTFVHDGRTEKLTTTDTTIGQLMADLSVTLGSTDRLTPPPTAALEPNATIVLKRVRQARVTSTDPIPFPTTNKDDSSLPTGQTQIITAGRNGLARITWALVYIDGRIAGRTKLTSVVLHAPTPQVVKVGTKSAASSGSSASAPKVTSVSPGSAQDIARKLLLAKGMGSDQFDCLVTLWNHESGWNTHAANPSGAYGIPQALPGSKMSSAGPDWQNSAQTQITWGLGYIASRYGTPCDAWSSWQSQGGWY